MTRVTALFIRKGAVIIGQKADFCYSPFCFYLFKWNNRNSVVEAFAGRIAGMQQFMGFVGVRFAKELFVQFDDLRVVVRLTDGLAFVFAVQSLRALFLVGIDDVIIFVGQEAAADVRLAAAVDTAAGAAHDLDELILGFAGTDLIQQDAGGFHTGGNSDIDNCTVDIDGGFADTGVMAADFVEFDLIVFLADELEVDSTQGSFHNTTGHAEDNAGTGVIAHDILIPIFIGEAVIDDTGALDHAGEFAGCDDGIDVGNIVDLFLFAFLFELLGDTGHDGNNEDVLRIITLFLGPVGFDDGTLHLMRGLAAGKMIQQIAVVVFGEVDPARGAGGDHRQDSAIGQTAEEFGSFFHDGQVSAEVDIVDAFETEAAQGSDHLTGGRSADLVAEFLTDGGADSRSDLDNDMLAGFDSGIDLADLGLFKQSAGRADIDTLTALDTRRVGEAAVLGRGDDSLEAAVFKTEDPQAMSIGTAGDAAAAEDTLGGIADKSRSKLIQESLGLGALVGAFAGTGQTCDMEQFAAAVLIALLAVDIVVGKQQFNTAAAGLNSFLVGDTDLHPFTDGVYTAGDKTAGTGGRDQTDTAGTDVAFAMVVGAQRGDLVAALLGSVKDRKTGFDLIRYTLDLNIY